MKIRPQCNSLGMVKKLSLQIWGSLEHNLMVPVAEGWPPGDCYRPWAYGFTAQQIMVSHQETVTDFWQMVSQLSGWGTVIWQLLQGLDKWSHSSAAEVWSLGNYYRPWANSSAAEGQSPWDCYRPWANGPTTQRLRDGRQEIVVACSLSVPSTLMYSFLSLVQTDPTTRTRSCQTWTRGQRHY